MAVALVPETKAEEKLAEKPPDTRTAAERAYEEQMQARVLHLSVGGGYLLVFVVMNHWLPLSLRHCGCFILEKKLC